MLPVNPYNMTVTTSQNATGAGFGNQNTNTSTGQVTGGNTAQNTANQYTAGSQALQGSLPGQINNFLQTGNLPGSFAAPSSVLNAWNQNYQEFIAPQLAATYGSGSNVLPLQQSLGLSNLLSNLYQTQSGNLNNVLNTGLTAAFNPIGLNASGNYGQQSTGTQQTNNNWQSGNTSFGSQNQFYTNS